MQVWFSRACRRAGWTADRVKSSLKLPPPPDSLSTLLFAQITLQICKPCYTLLHPPLELLWLFYSGSGPGSLPPRLSGRSCPLRRRSTSARGAVSHVPLSSGVVQTGLKNDILQHGRQPSSRTPAFRPWLNRAWPTSCPAPTGLGGGVPSKRRQ